MSQPGYIYFLEAAHLGLIKIGWAKDVLKRVKTLRTGSPVRLELRAIATGTLRDEGDLHRRFRYLRRKGSEWFKEHPALRELMAKHALPEPIYFSEYGIEPPWYREIIG